VSSEDRDLRGPAVGEGAIAVRAFLKVP